MERKIDESVADYKERRAAANLAVKKINWKTRGGTVSAREKLRDAKRANGKLRATYGVTLLAHFAEQNATHDRQLAHTTHLISAIKRKESRAGL